MKLFDTKKKPLKKKQLSEHPNWHTSGGRVVPGRNAPHRVPFLFHFLSQKSSRFLGQNSSPFLSQNSSHFLVKTRHTFVTKMRYTFWHTTSMPLFFNAKWIKLTLTQKPWRKTVTQNGTKIGQKKDQKWSEKWYQNRPQKCDVHGLRSTSQPPSGRTVQLPTWRATLGSLGCSESWFFIFWFFFGK